jgi:predicted RNA-binding Zn-ribbon protein involved in translation (DUF1610 family)
MASSGMLLPRHNIPEDSFLHIHRHENLKSYTFIKCSPLDCVCYLSHILTLFVLSLSDILPMLHNEEFWNDSKISWTSGIGGDTDSDVIQDILNRASGHSSGRQLISTLFTCPQCGKIYRRKYTLRRHIQVECGKEPQFSCPHCHRRIRHKHDLVVHMKLHCPVLKNRH